MLYLDVKNAFDDLAQLLYLKHQIIRQVPEKVMITITLMKITNSFFQFSESLRFIDQDDREKTLIAALEVVTMDRREASDPRDHYFGIIGLLSLRLIESQELRSLSYQNSTANIYKAVAHALYKEYGLEVLAYCYAIRWKSFSDGGTEEPAPVLSVPSWVPNWAGGWISPLQERLSFRSVNRYGASILGSETSRANFAIVGASLKIKGTVLDRVRITVPFRRGSEERPWTEIMRGYWAPWICDP